MSIRYFVSTPCKGHVNVNYLIDIHYIDVYLAGIFITHVTYTNTVISRFSNLANYLYRPNLSVGGNDSGNSGNKSVLLECSEGLAVRLRKCSYSHVRRLRVRFCRA